MKELSLPTKCLLMASATLMIGFSTLAKCRGNEVAAETVSRASSLETLTPAALTFIAWPKSSFAAADAPFVIGVLGTPGLTLHRDMLNKYATHHRLIQGRRVEVVRFESVEAIEGCHLLFISSTCSSDETSAALRKVFGHSVLTVGESKDFALAGGVMNFAPGKESTFELNPLAAKRQQLKIDGRLEALAKIIKEPHHEAVGSVSVATRSDQG